MVFFDRPRCILCYRCVRVCGEGMDVFALGVQNRGSQLGHRAQSNGDHLDCEQCGMCIDVCPVGALTSGAYRYKTRPWEMNHVPTVCTHCGDGCKTTLGVRRSDTARRLSAATTATRAASTAISSVSRAVTPSILSTTRAAAPAAGAQADGKLEARHLGRGH